MRNVIFSWTASVDEKGTPEEVGTGGASQPTHQAHPYLELFPVWVTEPNTISVN